MRRRAQLSPPSAAIRLRAATLDDASAISRLLLQLPPRERSAEGVTALLAASKEEVPVAEQSREVIGVATLQVHRMLHEDQPVARLTALVVDRACRRQAPA